MKRENGLTILIIVVWALTMALLFGVWAMAVTSISSGCR